MIFCRWRVCGVVLQNSAGGGIEHLLDPVSTPVSPNERVKDSTTEDSENNKPRFVQIDVAASVVEPGRASSFDATAN
jgi:hypothetical protein